MAIKNETDRQRKYDWVVFAQSYFLIAKLACQELLNTEEKKHSKVQGKDYFYQPADLFVSILFNIKHGTEVFVKALGIFAYEEYREGHDIHQLFIEVKQKISDRKISPPAEKKYYDSVTKEDVANSQKDLDDIEPLILYFYNLEVLKSKIGQHYSIKDTQNDFLRYPDNKAAVQVDWGTVLSSRIEVTDIKDMLGKLDELLELFNKVGYLYAILDRSNRIK